MVDKKKPATETPETDVAALDDKSINDLLKEYADDVKDKDLEDFLQDAPEDDDDAFESDDALMVEAPAKKSGGLVGLLLVLLLCGGAGAGAWWYMNRDDGMTNVMGGFKGEPLPPESTRFETTMPSVPLTPETPPALPSFTADEPVATTTSSGLDAVLPDDLPPPPQPTAAAPVDVPPTAPMADTVASEPVAPAVAEPVSTPPQPAAPVGTPTQPVVPVAEAVNDWLSGANDAMTQVEEKLPPVIETPVAEVKAKPVKIDSAQTARPVKADKIPPAPTATSTTTSAPRQATRAPASVGDAALPPPYLAIQARKGDAPPPTITAPAPAQARSDEPAVYIRGSTAHTEPSTTRAEGIYRDMVARGGGEIILDETTVQTPAIQVIEQTVEYATPVPAQNLNSALAISGGRSLPDGRTVVVATPRTAPVVSVPEGGQTVVVVDETVVTVPQTTPVVSAPAATISTPTAATGTAATLLQQARAAESAGQYDQAVTLYQRALEADAVYGDGRSIDRGAVYDRIGAIRARR